jgi:hypothetical protein
VLCSGEGHASANCPTRGKKLRLQTMGHAIAGGGFFTIEVEPLAENEQGAFSAMVYAVIVKFKSSPLSASQLADELKHMVDDH